MMKARISWWLLATLFLATVPFAEAQQQAKIHRIGFLSGSFPNPSSLGIRSIQRELRELGYIEGKNIAFEYRFAEDKPERSPAWLMNWFASRLMSSLPAAAATPKRQERYQDDPHRFFGVSVADPVALGLVASLARPGGNITGFTTIAGALAGKRLELLKEALPKVSRVAVLWNPQSRDHEPQWKESQQTARQLGLQLYSMEVSSADKYEAAFKDAVNARSAALAVSRHRLSNVYQKRIIELAAKNRLPAIYYREDFVENGGLMAYGADEVEPFKRATAMVDKILKGAKPADIPVEQSSKFEFVINLKTAKQIGLMIPPEVLARANRVIK